MNFLHCFNLRFLILKPAGFLSCFVYKFIKKYLFFIFCTPICVFLTGGNIERAQAMLKEEVILENVRVVRPMYQKPISLSPSVSASLSPSLSPEKINHLESLLKQEDEAKKEEVLRELIALGRQSILPETTINLLMNLVYYSQANYFLQELSARALRATAKWGPFPEDIISKMEMVVQHYIWPLYVRITFIQILKEQIQKHSLAIVEVSLFAHIVSNKKEKLEIRKEAVYPLIEWAKHFTLPDSIIKNMAQIVVDKKEDELLRVNVIKIFHPSAKYSVISPEYIGWFEKILEDKNENYLLRLSVMAFIVEISEHQNIPFSVLDSLTRIIYGKKTHTTLRRSAIQSFFRVAKNPVFQTKATLNVLQYIFYNTAHSRSIRLKARDILIEVYSYDVRESSLWIRFTHSLKRHCIMAFQ